MIRSMLSGCLVGGLCVMAGGAHGAAAQPGPQVLVEDGRSLAPLVPAEEAGWELVFTDTFDRAELGDEWQVVEGNWAVVDGYLVGSGLLISSRGFPGDHPAGFIRIEFEAATDVQPLILLPGAPPPRVAVSDLSAFIHAPPYEAGGESPVRTGYFMQFGGFMNTQNRIRRAGTELAADLDPETLITQGETHAVVAENDAGRLRVYVDGNVLLEHEEGASRIGHGFDRVGFYFYTRARVSRVRVYVKRLADDLI